MDGRASAGVEQAREAEALVPCAGGAFGEEAAEREKGEEGQRVWWRRSTSP